MSYVCTGAKLMTVAYVSTPCSIGWCVKGRDYASGAYPLSPVHYVIGEIDIGPEALLCLSMSYNIPDSLPMSTFAIRHIPSPMWWYWVLDNDLMEEPHPASGQLMVLAIPSISFLWFLDLVPETLNQVVFMTIWLGVDAGGVSRVVSFGPRVQSIISVWRVNYFTRPHSLPKWAILMGLELILSRIGDA